MRLLSRQKQAPMKKSTLFFLAGTLAFSACRKDDIITPNPTQPTQMSELVVPDGFDYQTTREIDLNITLRSPQDEAIGFVPVYVYDKPAQIGGKVIFTALTNAQGVATGKMMVPAYLENVYINPNFVGLPIDLPMNTQGAITMTIGGSNPTPVNRTAADFYPEMLTMPAGMSVQARVAQTRYVYKAGYSTGSNGGVPTNLISPRDIINNTMLEFINASLPEQKPVPVNHPDYLNPNANIDIQITALADVWVTFVHEGAGFKNTLGYYVFDTNNPPTSLNDIDTITYLFPNTSFINSGGGLRSGDKVLVGRFPAGKSIGWVLLSNAWSGTGVNSNAQKFFSNKVLNPESAAYKQHHVLLYDDINKLFLIGFEDQYRENGASDNDFNDLVYYVTSNPVTAINTQGVNPIDQPGDSDGDGVSDVYDRFPTNPALAYVNVFPAANTFGTLAFEDLWPGEGDYDMNDLVLDYQYRVFGNAQNQAVYMDGDFAIRAIGGTIRSGFAFQMPLAASQIGSVTGQRFNENYFVRSANGTETGVTQAVVPVFDNAHSISPLPAPYFLNTERETAFRTPDTVKIRVNFVNGVGMNAIGTAPFNPFIVVNRNQNGTINWSRDREIHLPGYAATSKANTSLFGTSGDDTRPGSNKWYKTHRNLPFALHMAEKYEYSLERKSVLDAYPRFADWSQSGGVNAKDWYSPGTANRNTVHIY